MTEKIDLRVKYEPGQEYPPDVKKLIEKHDGKVGVAEKAAGCYAGAFGKFRSGKEAYSDTYKKRVANALKGLPPIQDNPQYVNRGFVVPETCPKLIADLLRHCGSKKATAKALGTSEASLYAVIDGTRDVLPAWTTRARATLGLPVIYSQKDEPMTTEKPPITTDEPPFMPWDGKSKGTLQIAARGGKKGRAIKNVPQPIIDLVQKHGAITLAAAAAGTSPNTLTKICEDPKSFNDKWQRKIHAGLHGLLHREEAMGDRFDKYLTGFAIVLLKAAGFDHVADIAELLNANMVFKKNTSAGWILIYRMKTDDLPRFKKIAMRDANEIVCP